MRKEDAAGVCVDPFHFERLDRLTLRGRSGAHECAALVVDA